MSATEHPTPSARARELVRGGYDPHIHVAPDVVKRRTSDVALARRFAELGLAGFGLKSHYTSTAERARVVSAAVPEVDTVGAITLNRALADRPEGLRVTTHMCRGNNQSMWAASGSYDFVADALFNQLEVDGFFMEWDDERSGGFEPLRYVPQGKIVVLGLVTTKRPELEDKDMLKRRIEEASKYVDVDQLCLSPQCGFSSTREGNDLTIDEQFAKLELVIETADKVWGS